MGDAKTVTSFKKTNDLFQGQGIVKEGEKMVPPGYSFEIAVDNIRCPSLNTSSLSECSWSPCINSNFECNCDHMRDVYLDCLGKLFQDAT